MPGRHAAPGEERFLRELGFFALKVVIWGVIVFGAVLLIPKVSGLFSSPEPQASSVTTEVAAVTSTAPVTTAARVPSPSTTVPGPSTTSTTDSTSTTTTTLRPPATLTVQVLNSTDRDGLAAALTDKLAALGYQMVEADNYPDPLDISRVWYREGLQAEAGKIAEQAVPDASVEQYAGSLDVDILVVLGASYEGEAAP